MTLAGYQIPSAVPNTLTLNFRGGGEDVPTFSFADLRACVENGDMGRSDPVKIYEPLAESGQQTPEQSTSAAAYAEGLTCWRAREFSDAMKCFDRVAEVDPPSAPFRSRAKEFADNPLPQEWAAVNILEGK
jgi:hypothetical protein